MSREEFLVSRATKLVHDLCERFNIVATVEGFYQDLSKETFMNDIFDVGPCTCNIAECIIVTIDSEIVNNSKYDIALSDLKCKFEAITGVPLSIYDNYKKSNFEFY